MIAMVALASCGAPVQYHSPTAAPTASFAREMNGSFDQVWSMVTNVAGATFFSIKNFDRGSGLMTLDYSNLRNVAPYVNCGTATGGVRLIDIPGAPANAVLNYTSANRIALTGTGNITIRSIGPKRTMVQVNSLYTLSLLRNTDAGPVRTAQWRFTTQEADTEVVEVDFRPTPVTCQPSYKLEQEFLDTVASQL